MSYRRRILIGWGQTAALALGGVVAVASCAQRNPPPPRAPSKDAPAVDPAGTAALQSMRITLAELQALMARNPHVAAPFLKESYVVDAFRRGRADLGSYLARQWVPISAEALESVISSPGSLTEEQAREALELLAGECPNAQGLTPNIHTVVERDWVALVEWLAEQGPDPRIFNWEQEETGKLPLNNARSARMAELLQAKGAQRRSEAEIAAYLEQREQTLREIREEEREMRAARERREQQEAEMYRAERAQRDAEAEAERRASTPAATQDDWYQRKLAEARDPLGGLPNINAGMPPPPKVVRGRAEVPEPSPPPKRPTESAAPRQPSESTRDPDPGAGSPPPSRPEKADCAPADRRRPQGTCIEASDERHGKHCNSSDSYGVKLRNTCSGPVAIRICLGSKTLGTECLSTTIAAGDPWDGGFTCHYTGSYSIEAVMNPNGKCSP